MDAESLVVVVRRNAKGRWRWRVEVDGVRVFRSAKGFSDMWKCERDAVRAMRCAWSWLENCFDGRFRWDRPEDALLVKWDESARAAGTSA